MVVAREARDSSSWQYRYSNVNTGTHMMWRVHLAYLYIGICRESICMDMKPTQWPPYIHSVLEWSSYLCIRCFFKSASSWWKQWTHADTYYMTSNIHMFSFDLFCCGYVISCGLMWYMYPYHSRLVHMGFMMTSSNGNIFRVTGPLCGEFTGLRSIPRTKASDAELWCVVWSAPE